MPRPKHITIDDWFNALERAGKEPRRRDSDGRIRALCPSHKDTDPSLTLSEGDNGTVLVTCHSSVGCTYEDIRGALDLTPAKKSKNPTPTTRPKRSSSRRSKRKEMKAGPLPTGSPDEPRTRYDYRDADGKLVLVVTRHDHADGGKHFLQWTPSSDEPEKFFARGMDTPSRSFACQRYRERSPSPWSREKNVPWPVYPPGPTSRERPRGRAARRHGAAPMGTATRARGVAGGGRRRPRLSHGLRRACPPSRCQPGLQGPARAAAPRVEFRHRRLAGREGAGGDPSDGRGPSKALRAGRRRRHRGRQRRRRQPQLNERMLAQAFAEHPETGDKWRFDSQAGIWRQWDGARWEEDQLAVIRDVAQYMEDTYRSLEEGGDNGLRRWQARSAIMNVKDLARVYAEQGIRP